MASIDERVVAMSFENTKFEAGVAHTMGTLSKLDASIRNIGSASGFAKLEAEASRVTLAGPMAAVEKLRGKLGFPEAKASFGELEAASDKVSFGGLGGAIDKLRSKLGFPEAKSSFAEIEAASDKVTLSGVNESIDKTASHFSVLVGAASVAFGNLASQATMAVGRGVKASLGAIKDGFSDYELKIGSTQTIMAGTGENIGTVTKYLKDLDNYADRTIYNLRDMTGNIGKFTNAGVKLPVAVDAMKGIANEAALSGASAEEAARSMYNLGQAIGSGVVRLQDWRSVDLANMGTKEFKEQLIDAAIATKTLKKGSDGTVRSLKGNVVNFKTFNSTLQDQWLTSEALTKTLSKYSDENTKLGKRAYAAASDVKTVTMMIQTLSAATGTGWTDTFDIILGNLPEATKMWTDLTNAIGGVIGKSADMRNQVLKDWKALGGRTALIEGFKNMFEAIGTIIKPIKDAFRDIFPRKTGADLLKLTENFRDFWDNAKLSQSTMDNLQRTFAGLFAVLDIGWTIIKEVAGVIGDLFGVIGSGSGGFLEFTGGIGDWLVVVDQAITKGQSLKGIFKSLSAIFQAPLEIIKALASAFIGLFDGADPKKADGVATSMDKLNTALKPLRGVMEAVEKGWKRFLDLLNKIREAVEPAFTNVLDFLGDFGTFIADRFEKIDWSAALNALQTGIIAGIFVKLKGALAGGLKVDVAGGFLKNLNDGLKVLTGNLKQMQRGLQAATLLEIGLAIAILATGVFLLSQIPAKKLAKAMEAVALGLAELVGAVYLLTIASKGGLGFKIGVIAASMILLAIAVTILAIAMGKMAKLSWEEIAKGLVGVAGVLVAVNAATQFLNGPKILAAGIAMIPLAIGIGLLAIAVKIFSQMDTKALGRGILGLALSLDAIVVAMMFMPPNLAITGAGVVILAAGLILLSAAVGAFGAMDPKTLAQGLLGIGAALIMIGFAVGLIPPTLGLTAAAMVVMAVALNGIATAVAIFGSMDIGTLVKGIIGMGAALDVLAFGLMLMQGAIPGTIALLGAALAFAVLGPALAFMGQLKLTTLLKGLGAMALTLTILAIAGALASGPLTALGLGLAALGGGMLVISLALSLFVLALAQLGKRTPKAIAAMVAAFGVFLLVLPKMIIDFVKGLVDISAALVKLAPQIAENFVKIISTLLDAIIKIGPKIAEAVKSIVTLIAQVLSDNVPILAEAGLKLMEALLTSIRDHMPKIIALAAEIIVKFLDGLTKSRPKILAAGVRLLVSFITGITENLEKIVGAVAKMIGKFITSVAGHIPKIVKSGANLIIKFIGQLTLAVPRFIGAATKLVLAFLKGVGNAIPKMVRGGLNLAGKFLDGIANGLVGLADKGFHAVIKFLRGLERSIRQNEDDLIDAGIGVGDAIMDGIIDAFGRAGPFLRKALEAVFKLLPGWAKHVLGISSPSKVFQEIGHQTMMGMAVGIDDGSDDVDKSIEKAGKSAAKAASGAMVRVDFLQGLNKNPVITPVLDLTQIKKDAATLDDMTKAVPIKPVTSIVQATSISAQQATAQSGQAGQGGISFHYEQNNYSPESLSDVEIYRQTKNQLSTTKTGLGIAV